MRSGHPVLRRNDPGPGIGEVEAKPLSTTRVEPEKTSSSSENPQIVYSSTKLCNSARITKSVLFVSDVKLALYTGLKLFWLGSKG